MMRPTLVPDRQRATPIWRSMTSTGKKPLRVLLAEDRGDDEILLWRHLNEAFDLTMQRVDSADGMRRALAASPDLDIVISDYAMPSFTALDALRILHEDGRDLPFIILSGTVTDAMAVTVMRAGAHDYVMKDNMHRLRPAIERELQEAVHRRARRDAEAERDRLLARERDLRAAAEAAARLKDEFLNVLSHELRTPLTSILGWARTLRLREGSNPSVVQSVEAIERNGRTLTRLVEDLLDLSAILSGRLHLDERAVDLTELVTASVDGVLDNAAGKGVAIDVAVAANCRVWGDPDRLHQIVVNLLTNAVKFTPKRGRIWVSLERLGSEAVLTVRDTGIGIPAEFQPYVFDRFRQADGSVSRAFGGLGLGLSLVRHLTEMHGGRVTARSAGEGRGATFEVRLPAMLAGDKTPQMRERFADRSAIHGTVLLVDDDPDEREFARAALEACGATVVAVTAPDAAIDALNWARADGLVIDLELSSQNGHELIRTVRQRPGGSDIPALALTAASSAAEQRQALAVGFNAVLAKPLTPEGIVASVLDLLTHPAR
jgi:signal transduction histidine kinase